MSATRIVVSSCRPHQRRSSLRMYDVARARYWSNAGATHDTPPTPGPPGSGVLRCSDVGALGRADDHQVWNGADELRRAAATRFQSGPVPGGSVDSRRLLAVGSRLDRVLPRDGECPGGRWYRHLEHRV